MQITLNENKKLVETLQNKLKENGGYCPCKLEKTEDTKCMCKEFKEQINNPNFEGFCHCRLYLKIK